MSQTLIADRGDRPRGWRFPLLFTLMALAAIVGLACEKAETPQAPPNAAPTPAPQQAAAPGQGAPEIREVNVEGMRDTIARQRGRVVLLDVWATWCGPCIEEFPRLGEWQKKFGPDRLAIVALSIDSPSDLESQVVPFLRKHDTEGLDLLLYTEGDHDKLVNSIDPKWPGQVPALFLYDAQGHLRHSMPGEHTAAGVEEKIAALLPPPASPQ